MKLFVYATLKKSHVRKEVLGHDLPEENPKVSLIGWRELHEGKPGKRLATLKKDPNSIVEGEVFDVSPEDLKKLDDYEETYRRIPVKLSSGEDVETYVRRA